MGCKVLGRDGQEVQETTVRDPISGAATRVRSASPRGLRSHAFLIDDPLYDPLSRASLIGDPLYRRGALLDRLDFDRRGALLDPLYFGWRGGALLDGSSGAVVQDLARPFASDPAYTRSYVATDSL